MSDVATKRGMARPLDGGREPAPFLVWPVARREIYTLVAFSLSLPLTWGVMIFGWRALNVILATLAGAMATHFVLKRFTRRGRRLILAHTMASAALVGALAQGLWPPMLMLTAGAAMVGIAWLFGGPGHERAHSSVLVVMLASLLVPALGLSGSGGKGAILARDRLFMGDLAQSWEALARSREEQRPSQTRPGATQDDVSQSWQELARSRKKAIPYWPRSADIDGQDSVEAARPQEVVAAFLADVDGAVRAAAAPPGTPPATRAAELQETIRQELTTVLASRFPAIEDLLLGVIPGRIGAVSALGTVLGGLYLAYRNILRPQSCAVFLGAVIVGLAAAPMVSHRSLDLSGATYAALTGVASASEIVTLLIYAFFSGDILFTAVFILALPGSEPITPRGRWWFLVLAGLVAGLVHGLNLPVPGTALALLAFQPLAPVFDWALARRSWLNAEE